MKNSTAVPNSSFLIRYSEFAIHSSPTMTTETTYTQARANFKALLAKVSDSREIVIIRRRGCDDVALIAADELRRLVETVHLLRSPKNAARLFRALARAQAASGD